jgi:hypothetical protein
MDNCIVTCLLNTKVMERLFLRNYGKDISAVTIPHSDGCGGLLQTGIPAVTSL